MSKLPFFAASATAGMLFLLALPLTGLPDHTARPGSNPVADWYALTAARQSIALRSLLTPVPDLSDPAMIRRGAGHFELVCAACHGSPTAPPHQIAANLSPAPPRLSAWRPDARLFQTVKYGIAYTAMPAWPTHQRDDEIWDMVAFLRRLPTMDAATYEELAHGDVDPGSCAACHGVKGEGRGGGVPRLDIQSPAYLADALAAFRDGSRPSGTMMAAARRLSDDDIAEFATHFGRGATINPPAGNELGRQIAHQGVLHRDVPACDSCHGAAARADFPRLTGQSAAYLRLQLELFQRYGSGRGGKHALIMGEAVENTIEEGPHRLEPDEIEAVAAHYGQ